VSRYLARRIIVAVPTLLAISMVLFAMLHLAPGGPMAVYAIGSDSDPELLEAMERRLGLRDPLPLQYGRWLLGMASGDWGRSYKYAREVSAVIGERVLPSLELMGAALLLSVVLAIPLGALSALSPNRAVQHAASVVSLLGISIPTFWLGLMILLLFSVTLRFLPSGGMATIGAGFDVFDRLRHLIAPALVLATLEIAGWSRFVRSSLLEVAAQDYVRTARAKGLAQRLVLYRHMLRNALLPLITLVGLQGGRLVGGALVTEVVFAWPGMGRLLSESLAARDYPVVMAAFMIMAVLVVLANLLADLGYAFADPRVRLT
jgi:peptide/nickel transport system permease protein